MSEYTAEDFAYARFAEHEDWGTAAQTNDTRYPLWFVAKMGEPWFMLSHETAENGWRPVVEHNPHATDALEEEIQDLRDRLNAMVKENICRRSEAAPLTLDALREAWENAEVPTAADPIREGDTLIRFDPDDGAVDAWECKTGYHPAAGITRVLHRAPRPQMPEWQGLADAIADSTHHPEPAGLAKALYAAGVRVTEASDGP